MNYDSNVQIPEIAVTVANVAEHLRNHRLDGDQSLFLENFPIEHLSVLNSAIIAGYNVGIYTKADPVFGGAGVRIFSIAAIKSEKIEQRKIGDWTATRNGGSVWKERIGKWFNHTLDEMVFRKLGNTEQFWFNHTLDEMAFYWNKTDKCVEVVPADEGNDDWFIIAPSVAFAYMCEQGKPYRNGKDEPSPASNTELDNLNAWTGFKQVVWNYNVTDDVVKEFESYSDADYEVSAKGVNTTFEDAPLVAWLAYNAAKQYNKPKYDLEDL